ncbi:MAG: hypothetical protein NT027_15125 [Proteobacteria bacterium]|nr:hypothetical protein [Pseudomonadota bacterium]
MGRPKGCNKPEGSGRKIGTPNKRSEFFGVAERLRELDYDIIERLIQDIELLENPRDRVKAHLSLLEYCDARRKTIDKTVDFSEASEIKVVFVGADSKTD